MNAGFSENESQQLGHQLTSRLQSTKGMAFSDISVLRALPGVTPAAVDVRPAKM